MSWSVVFFVNSMLLGVGLAMDAFSVSMANGLSEPMMKKGKMSFISSVFAFFQGIMPLIGWLCVHTVAGQFRSFEKIVPWIALALLSYLGIKMIRESKKGKDDDASSEMSGTITGKLFFVQGIATSIDALSVGFTIASYGLIMAVVCAIIIAAITYIICMVGILLGKRFGMKLAGKAEILGGCILIFIGLEIFISSFF